MLGLPGGQVVVDNQDTQFGEFDARPMLVKHLQCQGSEANLFECPMTVTATRANKVLGSPGCGKSTELGIICQ